MTKQLLGFLSLIITITVSAQNLQEVLPHQDWRIIPGLPNVNCMSLLLEPSDFSAQSIGDFQLGRCIISSDETAVLMSYNAQKFGVSLLTKQLKIKWNTPLPGTPMAIGKFHDKLIVITTPEFKPGGWKNQFDAFLLDPASGKIATHKNLYTAPDDRLIEPKFFFIGKSNDFKLGIRTTGASRGREINIFGGADKLKTEYGQTPGFELISINDQLEVTGKIQLPVKKDYQFLGCGNCVNGALFFAYYEGDTNIGVQRVSPGGDSTDFRNASFDARNKTAFETGFFVSPSQPDVVYLNIDYTNTDKDRALAAFRFDFKQDEKQKAVAVVDKEYKRDLKDHYVELNREEGKPSTGNWDDLKTIAITDNGNKIIVIKEVQTIILSGGGHYEYVTGDAIVSVYNQQMQFQSNMIIPKKITGTRTLGRSSSFHFAGDTMYVVSGEGNGLGYHADYSVIDLAAGKLVKFSIPQKKQVSGMIDPQSTLWFGDGFIVNYLDYIGFIGSMKITTYSQKFSY